MVCACATHVRDGERNKFGDGKSDAGWLLQWQRRVGRYSGYGVVFAWRQSQIVNTSCLMQWDG